ncbi:hypothetical protein Halru_3030 [Halovivax ruber XH-70]|uniref:Uncharacterized protein n=1 Tax=Halovivax ruber (strain DSM 18193 / JCM 13892 / XH-70) TaxID=797302 RepID=L0IH75_HALRX|nr:hypothetical protein [Halovivax ruber]AGB17596.1 hypothetical protein Halru_3030 [Halovivax ruber XH-70]
MVAHSKDTTAPGVEASIDGGTATETGRRRRPTFGDESTIATARRVVFSLSLAAAAVLTILFLPELLAQLATGWTADVGAELGIHRLHVMGIAAVVATFLLGLFAQAVRPQSRVASMWGAFSLILVVSAGTVAYGVGRPEEVLPFLALTTIALVTHPAGRGLFRRGRATSLALLALLGVAAVPLLAFAATQLPLSTNPADSHAVEGHYVMLAGLALAPLAYGIPAALGMRGARLAAWLAALPIAYYGLLSLSFPAQVGSTGVLWGVAAVGWAVAFVAVAEYSTGERTGRSRLSAARS